ncbi:PucR family transcriptional regulator [Paratissierella segnis]|uniref:Helix-turn-helix domain-containing protein n=1 Tax=Paratissierella segnis TaxID=2763679 RepID=A0A926EUA7_9FIRM|nr:helix-turn-helix domain-containing protein [Paratissierella segnis]MBC8589031.1 helix-turn-helix domain-containing protein [Paratissierella segnis]
MKLNTHIIKEDLSNLWADLKIEDKTDLNLLDVKILTDFNSKPKEDIIYILSAKSLEKYDYKDYFTAIIITNSKSYNSFVLTKNIFFVKEDYNEIDVMNKVQDLFNYYNRWENLVYEHLLKNDSIKEILNLGKEIMGNPIALFDSNMFCISFSGEELIPYDDPIWTDVVKKGHTSIDLIPFLKDSDSDLYSFIKTSHNAFIYKFPKIDCNCLHCNLYNKETRCGSICMTEIISPLTTKSISLANYLSYILSASMERLTIYRDSYSEIEQIFIRYISNNPYTDSYLNHILSKFNWFATDIFRVLVIKGNEKNSTSWNAIFLFLNETFSYCQSFEYNDSIVIFQNITRQNNDILLETAMSPLINKLNLYCGISTEFSEFKKLKMYYEQADTAYSFGISSTTDRRIFYYQDYILDTILNVLTSSINLETLLMPEIKKLNEYDKETNSNYVDSLYIYLSTGKSLKRSSSKLFIHRNTFIYRLNKIIELIGKDNIDNPDNTLPYLLSCWIIIKSMR